MRVESFELRFSAAVESTLLGGSKVTHVVDVFFPRGAGVHVVGNHAFELSFEDSDTASEFFGAMVDVEVVILNELLERVVLELGPVGFGLSGGGNES